MIGYIKRYCKLKSKDSVFIGLDPVMDYENYKKVEDKLLNMILPIHDIAVDGSGFLCMISNPPCLIDSRSMNDVSHYFYCCKFGDVLLPSEFENNYLRAVAESSKRLACKGGYNQTVRRMVVGYSLAKGKFYNDFLFEKSINNIFCKILTI